MENSVDENKEMVILKDKKIPRGIPFVLFTIFVERYSYTGSTAILALYLNRKLNFDPDESTAMYHTAELLAYLFPIFGAIVSDSWLGHFKVVLWSVLLFSIGSLIIAIGAVETINISARTFTIIGLLVAVIGTGSSRAALTAFGGNQYKLPEQADQLQKYFSLQIFFIKLGSFTARFTNPILKEDVKCFGMNDCYPLAFGTGAIAMAMGFLVFLCGKSFYIHKPPAGNMLVRVSECVMNAIKEKLKNQKTNHKDHWLDYAEEKHGETLVEETKNVIRILILYLPLPVYWAVYQLQGSRWVFQATKMNGDLGFYTVKPDQMIALNPIFGLIALAISDYIIFPLLAKVKVTTLLQKMTIGGMLLVIASILAGLVELKIADNYLSILWLVPQYVVSAFSENFLYNSHLSFSYNEAPIRMKSVMTSFVFVVIAIGNGFVIIISGAKLFESLAIEFFFFAGILFIAMILFGVLASGYKPMSKETIKSSENSANNKKF